MERRVHNSSIEYFDDFYFIPTVWYKVYGTLPIDYDNVI